MWRPMNRFVSATLFATIACLAPTTTTTHAAAVQTFSYQSSGSVGAADTSIAGTPSVGPISFDGVSNGSLTTPGGFQLGAFKVAALPPSASLAYDNTGFTIYLSGFGSGYTYRVDGVLNGTINGAGWSNMVASVTSVMGWGRDGTDGSAPIALADLRIIAPQTISAPNNYQGSLTPLYGQIAPGAGLPVPAPEPSTLAAVAVGLAAWGLHRHRNRLRRLVA